MTRNGLEITTPKHFDISEFVVTKLVMCDVVERSSISIKRGVAEFCTESLKFAHFLILGIFVIKLTSILFQKTLWIEVAYITTWFARTWFDVLYYLSHVFFWLQQNFVLTFILKLCKRKNFYMKTLFHNTVFGSSLSKNK